jgi:anthranilate phosphoribosyltransferase
LISASPLAVALARLAESRDLSADQSREAVAAIIAGSSHDAEIAAFLSALKTKGETADELIGAAHAVRERMFTIDGLRPGTLDTCGTGGDGASSVNISTATAIIVSACGVPVAKHGNRSASGNSGSSEVLAELGVAGDADGTVVARCLNELGITFLFAPKYHPALRFAADARKQLGFRTLFNLVGPLANPARPEFQLIGVPLRSVAGLMASALTGLGAGRAAVVTGCDGLDEVTLAGTTDVLWVESGTIREDAWSPDDFGLPSHSADLLRVSGPAESAAVILRVLEGEAGSARDVILANVAAALLVAGRVGSLRAGVVRGAEAIDSGKARDQLERWRVLSRSGQSSSNT